MFSSLIQLLISPLPKLWAIRAAIKPAISGSNQDWISKLFQGPGLIKYKGYKIERTRGTSQEIEVHFRDTPDYQDESKNKKCWRGCRRKGTPLHCWWECKLVQLQPRWRTVWRFLKKLKIEFQIWSNNPTLGHISGENHNLKTYMYPNTHSSTIYNSQDMEAT